MARYITRGRVVLAASTLMVRHVRACQVVIHRVRVFDEAKRPVHMTHASCPRCVCCLFVSIVRITSEAPFNLTSPRSDAHVQKTRIFYSGWRRVHDAQNVTSTAPRNRMALVRMMWCHAVSPREGFPFGVSACVWQGGSE